MSSLTLLASTVSFCISHGNEIPIVSFPPFAGRIIWENRPHCQTPLSREFTLLLTRQNKLLFKVICLILFTNAELIETSIKFNAN